MKTFSLFKTLVKVSLSLTITFAISVSAFNTYTTHVAVTKIDKRGSELSKRMSSVTIAISKDDRAVIERRALDGTTQLDTIDGRKLRTGLRWHLEGSDTI